MSPTQQYSHQTNEIIVTGYAAGHSSTTVFGQTAFAVVDNFMRKKKPLTVTHSAL